MPRSHNADDLFGTTGSLPITRNQFHGDWNYTLHPTHDTPEFT
jgi:hypothetical protein